ncbi:YhcN/YlaJ family sporulation lipoprotein [Priestia endophytica]|nr:YhcN/YlaJ family sporulation lipoprotein [Priestia endophytica]
MNTLKYSIFTLGAVLLLATGCGANDNQQGQGGMDNNARDVRYNADYDRGMNDATDNNMNNYDMNDAGPYQINNDNNTARDNNDNDNNNNNNDDMRVDQNLKGKIEKIDGVKTAHVIVTGENAYVATVLDNNQKGEMTDKMKEKVRNVVKKADNNVDEVYVSSNPDFVKRVGGYVNDIQNGKPVEGIGQEFSELVRRVFPEGR